MGLDGISINQLRVTPEYNSSELNNVNNLNTQNDVKIVDGLSEGQKIDPDKEKQHENASQDFNQSENENETDVKEDVVKHDFSQSDKYKLEINEDTNDIIIIEKQTNEVIEKINSKELSKLVLYLANSQGTIVNRKF